MSTGCEWSYIPTPTQKSSGFPAAGKPANCNNNGLGSSSAAVDYVPAPRSSTDSMLLTNRALETRQCALHINMFFDRPNKFVLHGAFYEVSWRLLVAYSSPVPLLIYFYAKVLILVPGTGTW